MFLLKRLFNLLFVETLDVPSDVTFREGLVHCSFDALHGDERINSNKTNKGGRRIAEEDAHCFED